MDLGPRAALGTHDEDDVEEVADQSAVVAEPLLCHSLSVGSKRLGTGNVIAMSVRSFTASRVLPTIAHGSLDDYIEAGGGVGLRSARAVDPDVVIAELEASGLRGRGGAGFPTGTKWRTVAAFESSVLSTSMVVNAAEGEPGTFKDRAILEANPYAVIEGALIAATVVGARDITFATKRRFGDTITRLQAAVAEVERAGWAQDIEIRVVEGPDEYLYGEETALIEVLDGRAPLPRIAPPWRRGVVEVVADDDDVTSRSGLSADVEMATPTDDNTTPPVLINNVETLANVPAIVAKGAAWFREVGTEASPGTIVCTITGAVQHPGVVEAPMGTSLRTVLDEVGGGARTGRTIVGVLMGVSNAIVTADELDLPISYESMRSRGSGLGSASFIVIDDADDPVAVAAGASRFLAIESCGQCTRCKLDGLEVAGLLATITRGEGDDHDLQTIEKRLGTIADGARCSLASQHQMVVGSILEQFNDAVAARMASNDPVAPYLVAELVRIDDETTTLDESFLTKQPDWTHDEVDSGQMPAERLGEHRTD